MTIEIIIIDDHVINVIESFITNADPLMIAEDFIQDR